MSFVVVYLPPISVGIGGEANDVGEVGIGKAVEVGTGI